MVNILHREVAALLWRTSRLRIHFPEKHLHTEQEQNGAEGFSDIEHVANEGMERLGKAT